jgi:Flp pilus assembly protein TadD
VGDALSQWEMHERAEVWYRRAFQHDPTRFSPLARALAAQDDPRKTAEAISLCVAACEESDSLEPVLALAMVLIASRGAADAADHEPRFTQALASHGADPRLLMSLADLRLAQDRFQEAEQLYRRVLELQPQNAAALNNLTIALTELEGRAADAEPLIDRALELSGEQPFLLDTKGVVLLMQNRPQEAAPFFERAAALAEKGALYRFHYAVALWKSNESARARAQWRKIDQPQLHRQATTRLDRQLLEELGPELAQVR